MVQQDSKKPYLAEKPEKLRGEAFELSMLLSANEVFAASGI